jgi:Transposase IS116/IS110/IS902 family
VELATEIGMIYRFEEEVSLALYLGMATLHNSSGKQKGTKNPKHVNSRAKAASKPPPPPAPCTIRGEREFS